MNCMVCGETFTKRGRNQKYCSVECSQKVIKENSVAQSRRRSLARKANILAKECSGCGEIFIGGNANQRYCNDKCILLSIRLARRMTKDCAICGEEFVGRNSQKYCNKECRRLANKEQRAARYRKYYLANKEKIDARVKKFGEDNPEKAAEYRATSLARLGPDYNRAFGLQRNYGITLEEWNLMFIHQNEKCAICGTIEHGGRNWHTDHNHETGKVRGILCHHCNHMLGNARDNADTLNQGINYLLERN